MMAKIVKGGGFAGSVKYTLDDDGRNEKLVIFLGAEGLTIDFDGPIQRDPTSSPVLVLGTGENGKETVVPDLPVGVSSENDFTQHQLPNVQPIIEDFEMQAKMNPKVEVPVRHFILSYSPEDLPKLNNEVMAQDAKTYLNKMGYGDTQYMIVRHCEKDNPHVHIIANAVDNNGKKIPDNFDFKKSNEICKEITLKRGYTWGEHKCTSQAQDIHNPVEAVKYDLCRMIAQAVEYCDTVRDLPEELSRMDVGCNIKFNQQNVPVGITFSIEALDEKGRSREYRFPGSRLGREFSCHNLDIACQLRKSMPELIKAAYQIEKDYGTFSSVLPEARKEFNELKRGLKLAESELKRLEARHKEEMSRGKKLAVLAVLCGPPFSVAIPILYMTIKTQRYKEAKERYIKEIRQNSNEAKCAKRMIGLLNNTEGISERYFQTPAQSQEQSRGMRMKR